MKIQPHEIAFDFDGVIADTFRLFTRLARDKYGLDIEYDTIRDYEFLDSIDMDKDHAMEIIDILTHHAHEIGLDPFAGALDVLKRISEIAPLFLVTARPVSEPVVLWFKNQRPLVSPRIEATGINTAKLDVLKDAGTRFFIDDRLDTCRMLDEAGITPIVYDQPWNREPHPFAVVKDWDEISDLIAWE
ncbi:MAG: haloacid dehalogenase [Thermodesulfobacteriota bacterium]|nr:haloacid dehalogenase [Thermodesulfobacteriota bacterium]